MVQMFIFLVVKLVLSSEIDCICPYMVNVQLAPSPVLKSAELVLSWPSVQEHRGSFTAPRSLGGGL